MSHITILRHLSGIREEMEYELYMNCRLDKLSFHTFEQFIAYKATWQAIR